MNVHKRDAVKFQIMTKGMAHSDEKRMMFLPVTAVGLTFPVKATKKPLVISKFRARPTTLVATNLGYWAPIEACWSDLNVQWRFQKKPLVTPNKNAMDCDTNHGSVGTNVISA